MSSEDFITISDDSDSCDDEPVDIPDLSVVKSSSVKEQKNGIGVVCVISCPMGDCKVVTYDEKSMLEHIELDHDDNKGIKSEKDGPLRKLNFNVEAPEQDKGLNGKNKEVGVSVITCPMGCPMEKNNAESMREHVELYHFGEENEREETTGGSDEEGFEYNSNFNVEVEPKKGKGKGKFSKESNHEEKEKKRHGGRVSNVPKADDMVSYKGSQVKYRLVQLNGMVETAEKNLFDIEHGKTRTKWRKSMYYEWLKKEVPESKAWKKETLKTRTANIEEWSQKFIMSKKEGKKTGMGDYDKELDPQLCPDRKETYVKPRTQEEKNIAELKMKFNQLKKSIDQAKYSKPERYIPPKLAAKANAVNQLFEVDEGKFDQTPKTNRRLPSTLQGKDENLYEKSRNIRDISVATERRSSKQNVPEEEDINTKVAKVLDLAVERLQNPQQANVHPGFPVLPYPYPGMFGPPGGYYHNMMFMNPMGFGMAMHPGVQNSSSSGENLGESAPATSSEAGGPVVPPIGGGWPVTAAQMYPQVPGWPMAMSAPNQNMASSSATFQVPITEGPAAWQMPNVRGPALSGYTSNPPGPPAPMPSTSSTGVPPVSTPGVIVTKTSASGSSVM